MFFLACSLFVPGFARAADQCVACHTDPAKLQALIKPAAEIGQEEGEG